MKRSLVLLLPFLLLLFAYPVYAQNYHFRLDSLDVDVYINDDGTGSLDYRFKFTNLPSASPIDYVDVGMPVSNFSMAGIKAEVNGNPVQISSDYQGDGVGFAVDLGAYAIQPSQTATVRVVVPKIGPWLRYDSNDKNYASFVFSPTWFGKKYLEGTTDMRVTFHLPPGVQPDQPRWHASPSGWPDQPEPSFDDQGRITYTWKNPQALGYEQYKFGASFPTEYVPPSAVTNPSIWELLGISEDTCFTFFCCGGIVFSLVGTTFLSAQASKRRRMQYMSPKIAIEGLGIKRGLTAVEAAIVMEQPLDKILTMILFGVIKKNAASVKSREPLTLEISEPLPEGLHPYEQEFLKAFDKKLKPAERRKALQTMTINLVNSVSNKMKGFSRKETIAYYRDIIERAWKQVETAQTPEVKSEAYDKYLEWTMLDKNYDDRTREVFRTGPVYIPTWWGRYDPTWSRPISASKPLAAPAQIGQPGGAGGGSISLPTLPGSAFAASVVNSVQNFAGNVIGNVTEFTSGVTNKTNPMPVATSTGTRTGGGGGGCACACACAGCACACAGGGR